MNQFYKFIFIVINLWLSSSVLYCSTYSDNMKEAVPFHLDYTSTPFSFNFQLNPDDYIMESSDSCSYKLFKSENENDAIISSNDCSVSNINNLEPATEYSIEFVFGHGRRLSIKRTKLTTESLNYQVIHFGLKAFEYVSVHSFFDENQNEMCRLYDSDTGEQLNCGKKDECNCKTDIVTNLETGKSYNIRIVKINGTNLGHLSVKTMIKPEFDVSSDSNGLNVKYDYKDIITMPKSCKLFIINNDNSSEALNTESIDLLEHNPAVQETDCNSISNIKLEEKSEQTSHHLILTDRFNQQIHSLTIYSQDDLTVAIFYIGVRSVYYRIHGNDLTESDQCSFINETTREQVDCAVLNSLGQKCSCSQDNRLINLISGQNYILSLNYNDLNRIVFSFTVANRARFIRTDVGFDGLFYQINIFVPYNRLESSCFVCVYDPNTDQEGGCCKNGILHYGFDPSCTGYEFRNLTPSTEYIVQGCDHNGDEWFGLFANTVSLISNVTIDFDQNRVQYLVTYQNEQLPNQCIITYIGNVITYPFCLTQFTACNCRIGTYFFNQTTDRESTIVLKDMLDNIIFSAAPNGSIFIPFKGIQPTIKPSFQLSLSDPTSIGIIVGIIISALAVCTTVGLGVYFFVNKNNSRIYHFDTHTQL